MNAIVVEELGGPEVLQWKHVADPLPEPGQLVVEVEAAGVNFMDTYQRTGLYKVDLPFILGSEGAGEVVAVGEGVTAFKPGDRVGWCDQRGSYGDYIAIKEARAVPVPDALASELAAASLLQGATAHYLVNDTFPLRPGQRCLIHAAAGGVGRLLVQMAKQTGAEVIATAGGPDKVALAKSAGADHVIDYKAVDFVKGVEDLIGKNQLDVVYDGVGKATFEQGLTLLKPRGMMVNYGSASGPPDPFPPLRLSALGSLYLTRPGLGHHVATAEELRRRTAAVFGLITSGALDVRVGLRLPIKEAADAHRKLEARETTGKVLLVP
ncbi:MAG TPA: quinone oxidoreductase [Acidimicrobiia bacterium]|nr:quinone oxidoreductase [Acidimicrobiia bacterium]